MMPKIIDLFSGCGGLALGFEKAGFDVVAGVELMPEACKTISYNLDYRYGREKTHICADITKLDASIFSNSFGEEGCIVIGGPPCQAYSLAGRAKLRSLGEDRINTNDARGYLYQDFLRFAYDLDAKAVIMENVPESTCYGEMNIPEIVCDSLIEHGYDAYWTLLNSADYGVPQLRERIFVIAKKKTLGKEIRLPIPSNKCTYEYKTRNQKKMDLFRKSKHFYMPNSSEKAIYPWVTVGDALSDLPILFPNSKSKYRNVKLNEEMDYRCDPKNEFQDLMRNWYGTESFGSSANAFRNTKRDFAIFEKMNQGDDYVVAHQIAEKMFESEVRVFGYKKDSNDYKALHKKMVPVYDTNKFERKWLKLNEKRPSHTIVAHLCKDTYSHIHPVEPRGISVREAARIQSFPDDFYFSCSMGDAYKQIGNAVPPLLAFAVADKVYDSFAEV